MIRCTGNPSGDGKLALDTGIPEPVKPWAWVAVVHALRGDVRAPFRQMPDAELRHMAATIGVNAMILPHLLTSWRLPQLDCPSFWAGTVLPAIRTELERRSRPKRVGGQQPYRQAQGSGHR